MSEIINQDENDVLCTFFEKSKQLFDNEQQQEIHDIVEILKYEQSKYLENKILFDIIEDIADSEEKADPDLRRKVKDVLLSEDLRQTSSIGSQYGLHLLGVNEPDVSLTYSESGILQENILTEMNNISKEEEWSELASSNHQLGVFDLDAEDQTLLEYKNKLNLEHQKYVKQLLTLYGLLEELVSMKLTNMSKALSDKLTQCKLEQKINHLKCNLAQEKCRIDIFTETRCSLMAYKELIKDLSEQQKDCQNEIENLNRLKVEYHQISGKQYDDILKSYLHCKASLEKKKALYRCLKD